MKTDILNPKSLFQKDIRYTIPPFQRPYVWTHDNQWEPLWDDVRNVAEDYLEQRAMGNGSVDAERKTKPHFLGAIVLQQVATPARDIEQREVIDGQQRMTTLQLLLDAVQQVCEEMGSSRTALRLSRLVINNKDLVGENPDDTFKLWPTRTDRQAFRHAMDNGLAVNDFKESLIVQAHDFFQRQVEEWLQDSANSVGDKVEALETTITAMVNIVVIDLEPLDDPNVIFETLNARGTPLAQSDLIKNFVLAQSSAGHETGLDIWGNLDDPWWRREVRQGRLYRPRLDMLFNYWIAMMAGDEVSPSGVFNRFRDYVGEGPVEDAMSAVRRDLGNYKRYEDARESREEEQFFYRTNVMQMGAITPVLLLLLSSESSTRIKAFQALESYLIRRMVCRQTTKDYNRLILELAIKLREKGVEAGDKVVAGFLKEQTADARKWPENDTVANALESSPHLSTVD